MGVELCLPMFYQCEIRGHWGQVTRTATQGCDHLPKHDTRKDRHGWALGWNRPWYSSSSGLLTCHQGNMQWTHHNLSHEPVKWPTQRQQTCDIAEVCQETLLLIDVGEFAVQAWGLPTLGSVPCISCPIPLRPGVLSPTLALMCLSFPV